MNSIVEIWTVGPEDSQSYVLIKSTKNGESIVINGNYNVKPNKEESEMFIYPTGRTHESHYMGDLEYLGNYIETIEKYRETKQIIGVKNEN